MKRLIVCDYPSKFSFPNFGLGSSEKRIWHFAKVVSELDGYEVILTGPLWIKKYVPKAYYFPKRLDSNSIDSFLNIYKKADYLFAGHEYFDKDQYVEPFLRAANKLISYHLHPYNYEKISFDGKIKHLFCYSQEMMNIYKDQHPHKALLYDTGVNEEAYLTPKPKKYLVWMGRIDEDKSPHYAVLAASQLNLDLYLLGRAFKQPGYEKKYSKILNLPNVKKLGVISGPQKMKIISEAVCGVYTIGSGYIEAGASTLGEMIRCGIPLAGMTWKDNDAVCEAVDDDRLGKVIRVNKNMSDEEIAVKLAKTIKYCIKLDRKVIYKLGGNKFNPKILIKKIFKIVDNN